MVAVYHHFFIYVVGAGIYDIVLDGKKAGANMKPLVVLLVVMAILVVGIFVIKEIFKAPPKPPSNNNNSSSSQQQTRTGLFYHICRENSSLS